MCSLLFFVCFGHNKLLNKHVIWDTMMLKRPHSNVGQITWIEVSYLSGECQQFYGNLRLFTIMISYQNKNSQSRYEMVNRLSYLHCGHSFIDNTSL